MNAKSLLWGLTLFVLSLQQMYAQFTVGTLDRDAYKYWLVDDKYTKDWNVYFAEQEYSGKKVQCGILADSVVAGKTYQVIERTGVDMTADTLLYRQEGKKVFRHTENDGTDILLFDFGLNEGDEFVTYDGETWIVADIDEEYQNWDNTNRKFVLIGKEDGEQKDVWVEDVGSLYTGILTRADLPPTNTPRLLYCRQIEMTSWRFDVNLPSYDAVFFLDGDFRNEEDLYFFESLLMDNSLDGDSLFVEFIGDSLRLYGIMEINMYVYLMESREQDGIINLNRTDVHFGDEYLGHARRWIDIVIPGFEEGEYEVVYEGKSLGKYTCKGKKQPASMFDGNPQWVYVHHYLLADAGYYEMGTNKAVHSFYKYYVEGSDVINNKTYHRLYADYVDNLVIDIEDDQYKKLEPEFSDSSYTHKFVCHLREENGCVYGIKSEMDYLSVFNPYTITDGDEVVLYDFNNWHVGYEQPIYHNWTEKLGMTWKINDIAERVMMDNSVRTVLNINDIEHIEGVGPLEVSFVYNPISNPLTSGYTGDYYLNIFVQNDNIVYRAPLPDEATDKEGSQYGVYREDPFLTKDTPTDMSFAIKNATFDTEYDYSGWEGDSFRGYRPVSTCGGFTGDDTWQDLENLPEGMYRVGVRGLYCYGYHIGDWMRKDDPSVRYAKLYGQSGENRLYHELPTISSAASESKVEGLGTYNDNGMYVPYNMEEFTAFKNAGLVKETSVLVPVGKDGKLRIGMSRDYMKVSIDLCFVDDFSLTYYGNSDDAFYMWRDEVIGTSLNKEKIAEHKVVYNKTYMEKYDKTINDAKNAGNKDDITVCVPKVKIAADSLVENISAYYWYGQLVEDIREYFNKYPDMTDENTAGLKSYVFTYFEPNGTFPNGSALYILDKAGLTTEEIRAEHTVIDRTFRGPVHTSIEKVEDNSDGVRTDNAIYDLMGRRLNGVPAKGIYIQNGKKYVR